MKARALKKLLNNTEYLIGNHREYIAIGSSLCHNLISVNKETLKIKLALDTWNEGRKSLVGRNEELIFIHDKLVEMIESGEIKEIIDGQDEIKNPLPVFFVKDGKLVESVTDAYGWPNTTIDGYVMHDNTHFPDKKNALLYGIREWEAWIKMERENRETLTMKLQKSADKIGELTSDLEHLNKLLQSEE